MDYLKGCSLVPFTCLAKVVGNNPHLLAAVAVAVVPDDPGERMSDKGPTVRARGGRKTEVNPENPGHLRIISYRREDSMKYALVDGNKTAPIKKGRGICQCCGGGMVAKCGRVKMWHWAHTPKEVCDPWWGPETEWHRMWKDQFSDLWQEIIHIDERTGGETHCRR